MARLKIAQRLAKQRPAALPPLILCLQAQHPPHRVLRGLFNSLRKTGLALDTLSMGMNADLEAAVAEGATVVRVGSAIFGARG